MKKRIRVIMIAILTLIAIAALAMVVNVSKAVEIKITFPEMSSAQRNFVLPLVNGFKEKTGDNVDIEYKNSSDIKRELESGNPQSDLYYVINNLQLRQLQNDSLLVQLNVKKENRIPERFFINEHFIPISWYPWGIYYNKSIFSDLNLSEPESWDEFLKLCETIKSEGYTPLSLMTKIKWPSTPWFDYINILMNGEEFHRELLAGDISFTDERVKTAFSKILNLHNNGFIHMESESFEWESMISRFEEEQTLMYLSGSFFYENTAESSKSNLGWFPFPEVKTLVASSSGFVSPAGNKNQRAIRKFLNFVLSEEGQSIIQNNSNLIAVHPSVSGELDRNDLDTAIAILDQYESIIPVFERNTHEKLLIPFKSAINSLYSVTDERELDELLENLEEYRKTSIK